MTQKIAGALVPVLTLVVLGALSCAPSRMMDFERVENQGEPIADAERLLLEQGSAGIPYLVRQDASFPVYGFASEFAFHCSLSGDLGFFLSVYAFQPDELEIFQQEARESGEPDRLASLALERGLNEVPLRLSWDSEHTLHVRSASNRDLLVSSPVFYRMVPPEQRRCVFLISVDTLSALHLSLYGYGKHITPHLDAFAQDGVLFTSAYANSSWTVASHMSLFTSLLEHRHRVKVAKGYADTEEEYISGKRYIFPLSDSIPSLVESLSRRFICISRNGGGNVSPNFGFFRGFDQYLSRAADMNDPRAAEHMFTQVTNHLDTFGFPQAFYFLHTYQVHMPYNPEDEFLGRLAQDPPLNSFDFDQDMGGMRHVFRRLPPERVLNVKTLYDAEILAFDQFFGDFLAYLKSSGLYERSLIILLSDHGEAFLEHGSWAHATDLYNEQIRVPLIVKFPHQAFKGSRIEGNVSLVDVLPTLLDFLGIEGPLDLDGGSLMGRIRGQDNAERTVISSLFRSKPFSFLSGKLTLIQGDTKLIFNEAPREKAGEFFIQDPPDYPRLERYDLGADPLEAVNLGDETPGSDRIRRLYSRLLELADAMKANTIDPSESHRRVMPRELIDQLKALGYIK